MKKILFLMLGYALVLLPQLSIAEDIGKLLDVKMDQAANYLNKSHDTSKAWDAMIEVSTIIKNHPEYDDGEYAEGMNSLMTDLMTKPWKYSKPYIIGTKGGVSFQKFIVDHINELSSPKELKIIKKNILNNCDQSKYPICKKLIIKIDHSM